MRLPVARKQPANEFSVHLNCAEVLPELPPVYDLGSLGSSEDRLRSLLYKWADRGICENIETIGTNGVQHLFPHRVGRSAVGEQRLHMIALAAGTGQLILGH